MLVARINRPGARLVLDNAPSPPKIDQLTLVRIILPLSRDQAIDPPAAASIDPSRRSADGRDPTRGPPR